MFYFQGSNGTAEKQQPEFDYMQGHPPQGYGAAQMNSPNADPYMSSYYTHQYMFPTGQEGGTWSNGGDPMSLLGGYGQVNGEYMSGNGMYGNFDYNQFGWGFSGGDFQAWGAQAAQRKDEHAYSEGGYYNVAPTRDNYGNMNGEMEPRDTRMNAVESGLKGMSLGDKGDVRDSHHGGGHAHGGHHGGSGGGSSHHSGGGGGSGAPKKMSWASVASQPARPQPQMKPKSIPRAPLIPGKHPNMDIGTWDGRNNPVKGQNPGQVRQAWGAGRGRAPPPAPYSSGPGPVPGSGGQASSNNSKEQMASSAAQSNPVLDKLKSANAYNPKEFNLSPKGARFFIIKSYSEDDIHRSIKYSIWCSTEHGNKRLDSAYREREGKGPIYLFFSVNGSGHFCGMAQMSSPLDYHSSSSVWAQDKWKGQMEVKWIYVKDVPNSQLRHIRLENNENKPVTNSRDTQEVPPEKGKLVLKILHHYRHTTSIFDDFNHYEKRQEEEVPPPADKKVM